MFPPGTVIDEKYTIVAPIGGGGFGSVYLVQHEHLGRKCALKVLHTALTLAPDAVPRFEREAKALHALKHKNIVGFYGYGVCPDSAPYMVMEYVEGKPLSNVLTQGGALDSAQALRVSRQIFEALACAHAFGIIHRDLKPSNIIIDADGDAKIIDFGLAKLMPEAGATLQKLTETGFTLGSFQYAAPEQAFGSNVDARADLYSAGCIIYHMLSGRPPFEGNDPVSLMQQHISESPASLEAMGPDATALRLAVLAANCMCKSPDERYQSATEALLELDKVVSGKTLAKRASHSGTLPENAGRKRLPTVVIGAAVCALLVCGALGFKFYQDSAKAQADALQAATDAARIEHFSKVDYGADQFGSELISIDRRHAQILPYLTEYQRYLLSGQLAALYGRISGNAGPTHAQVRESYRSLARHYVDEAYQMALKHPNEDPYWRYVENFDATYRGLHDKQMAAEVDQAMVHSSNLSARQSGRCAMLGDLLKAKRYDEAKKLAKEGLAEPGGAQSEREFMYRALQMSE